ncbi:MAG: hypothetical protein GQ540_03735 [Lutibacter sp.]|uniref:hypothetical protein n=1 Tax=Lutibacter sp. TaxID=1925666 RepID=UPI0019EF963A|nr:hypothetical protein [Lutibacter sp.]NOR27624.1 hypothetical protein [Lutibacter sp.]
MNVKQQSPEHTPELFYMPFATGEFKDAYDDEGNVIGQEEIVEYTTAVEVTTQPDHASLKRKCKDGIQELRVYPNDQFPIKLYVNDVLLAEQSVVMEVSGDGGATWEVPATVDKIIDYDNDGVFDALVSTGEGSYLSVSCNWNSFLPDPDKQVFIANSPGKLVRIGWYIKSHNPEFNMRYDEGEDVFTELIEGEVDMMHVVFSPNGIMDYLEV